MFSNKIKSYLCARAYRPDCIKMAKLLMKSDVLINEQESEEIGSVFPNTKTYDYVCDFLSKKHSLEILNSEN